MAEGLKLAAFLVYSRSCYEVVVYILGSIYKRCISSVGGIVSCDRALLEFRLIDWLSGIALLFAMDAPAIVGDRWWPQKAKSGRGRGRKKHDVSCGKNVTNPQMLEVSLLSASPFCLVGENPTCSVPGALWGCEGLWSYDYGHA